MKRIVRSRKVTPKGAKKNRRIRAQVRRDFPPAPTVQASECSTLAMVAGGNENRFTKVVDGGVVKQWVGIGWVSEGPEEYPRDKDLPRVVRP
jgi:hypothetical protein